MKSAATNNEQPSAEASNTALIDHILADAREEAQKIRAEADASVAARERALEQRLAQIDADTDGRIGEERDRQRTRVDAAIALAEGRAQLRMENHVYELARRRTLEAMAGLRDEERYAEVIRDWIVEAARGLGSAVAIVQCATEDRQVAEAALTAAGDLLAREHDVDIELRLDETAIAAQGVVLRDPEERLSYTNTVVDRMRRFAGELQRIVYHTVIEGMHGRTDHR